MSDASIIIYSSLLNINAHDVLQITTDFAPQSKFFLLTSFLMSEKCKLSRQVMILWHQVVPQEEVPPIH
jgi:hypothetical protein